MRLCLLCCALLLSACMRNEPPVIAPPHNVPADLLQGCPGYLGPFPETDGQISDAHVAEWAGRLCANGRLAAIDKILNTKGPQ